MKRFVLIIIVLLPCICSFSQQYYHFPTEHFDVYYQKASRESAIQLIQEGKTIFETLTDFYGIQPKKRLKVYLLDTVDFSNAYADIFSNVIIIYINRSGSDYYNNTYKWWVPFVFSHELTHILVANKSDWTKDLMGIFGHPVSILYDTAFTPSHFHEGVSIYSESLIFEEGRLNDHRYLSYLKAEIQDNGFRGLTLAGGMTSPEFTPTGFNYLYGSYFIQYIEEHYGSQAVSKIVNQYGNEYRFNFIRIVEEFTQKPYPELIANWKSWLYEITAKQSSSDHHQIENITNSGYYSGISGVSDQYLYYFSQKKGTQTTLYRTDETQTSSMLLPIPTDFAVSPSDQIALIYANPNGYEQYDLNLYTGRFMGSFKRLEGIKRPVSVEWLDDETLVYCFLENGGTGLATYNLLEKKTTYLLSPSPDFYINDISCYQGRLILSITYNGTADVYELHIEENKLRVLFQTQSDEIDVFLCPKGILFASNQEGEFDIYLYDESDSSQKKLTNSQNGAFTPIYFNDTVYFRAYSGMGFDFIRLIQGVDKPVVFEGQAYDYPEIDIKEDPVIQNVLEKWHYQHTLLPIPRFGIPALFILNDQLTGIAGFAGWDDLKEWIWYGYLGGIGELFAWDYSLIHRGFPDFQLTWNGNTDYEELRAAFHFPFTLREDERAAYIEPAINLGVNHTRDDLPWNVITDFYFHQAFNPIVYPDNPVSVPQFFQAIQLGTSGFFSQTGIGLALPYSMTGMISQRTAYSNTSLQAETWYPMNFIPSVGTTEGKFRLSSPILHLGMNTDLTKKMPYAGIIGVWIDVGLQYWLDFRLTIDLYIGEEIQPKIGIQNTLLGMI